MTTIEDEAEEEDTLELTDEMDEGEELLLDSDDVLTTPVGSAPIEPPIDEDEMVAETTPTEEKPKVRETGTLFERMSNIARGAAQAQVNDDEFGTELPPRADRHPALPKPAEQPVVCEAARGRLTACAQRLSVNPLASKLSASSKRSWGFHGKRSGRSRAYRGGNSNGCRRSPRGCFRAG